MTKAEFLTRHAEAEARIRRSYGVPPPVFSAVYLVTVLLIPSLILGEVVLVVSGGPDVRKVQVLIGIVFTLGLAFALQYRLRVVRRTAKAAVNELGLVCPHCRKSLFRRMESGEGAGKCPFCGTSVFEARVSR